MDHPLDLRKSLEIVRRHLAVVWIAVALGLLGGTAYGALNPPIHESTALVVLPSSTSNTSDQVVAASSTPVLQRSLSRFQPALSLQTLRSRVQVANLTTDVISITAQGRTDSQAEDIANAVADSYVAYIGSANSSVGPVPARILVAATNATAPRLLDRILATALAGLLLGTAIGIIGALAIGRHDRRLRRRDDIADAIGVPVLASISLGNPAKTGGWTQLLENYEPSAADAWRLRTTLHDLKLSDVASSDRRAGSAITVLSLASDQRALTLGPQLAAFAASLGIPTLLVVGPHQGTKSGAALHAAAVAPRSPMRSGRLQFAVHDSGGNPDGRQDGVLTVVVAVVDAGSPQADYPRAGATVLGVSAGEVTATQLARVAASATADGGGLAGILVGDPVPGDASTGCVPQLARPNHPKMPSRLTVRQR